MFKSNKEYLRRYGKFLIARQEESADGDYVCPYTNLRYVSQEEINQIVAAFPQCAYKVDLRQFQTKIQNFLGLTQEKQFVKNKPKFSELVEIPIIRTNTPNRTYDGTIQRSGYYRVEVNKQVLPYFLTACAGGIPINRGRPSRWEEIFLNEWRERYRNGRFEKIYRDAEAKEMKKRRARLLRIPEKRESRQFFQAVSMASAVERKVRKANNSITGGVAVP